MLEPTTTLLLGDCLERMREIPSDSVDAVVTDPPAGIAFMGKEWDGAKGGRGPWIGWLAARMAEAYRIARPGSYALVWALPRTSHWTATAIEDAGWTIRDRVSHLFGTGFPKAKSCLKPACEDWWLALKPAAKVPPLQIDACRVGTGEKLVRPAIARHDNAVLGKGLGFGVQHEPLGRWPANVVLDEEAAEALDAMSGTSTSRVGKPRSGKAGAGWGTTHTGAEHDDSGGASRFFYTAKASRSDRGEANTHPTVKSTALMTWLCRLITPPGGTILDPFMGSGSTGKAAAAEGFGFIGIERDPGDFAIAERRIASARDATPLLRA